MTFTVLTDHGGVIPQPACEQVSRPNFEFQDVLEMQRNISLSLPPLHTPLKPQEELNGLPLSMCLSSKAHIHLKHQSPAELGANLPLESYPVNSSSITVQVSTADMLLALPGPELHRSICPSP